MPHKRDLEQLISGYERRLQKLKEQQARYGIATEAHILLEIEDIEAELEDLRAERVALADLPRLNPYRGLAIFREEDETYFFGREQFTTQLVASVRQKPLVAVLGPSGSGKSSVIFAGLIPRLRQDGKWLIAHFRPGHEPFRSLAGVLLPLYESGLDKTDQMARVPKLASYLREGDFSLGDITASIFQVHLQAQHLLLVVDQFEELYTSCPDQNNRQCFLDRLLQALPLTSEAHPAQPLHIILALRADFLGQALLYPPFGEALQGAIELLRPMTPDEMRRAIEKPAALLGVSFEAGLVERILAAVSGECGKLPLLEFALTALWNEQVGEKLTHAVYNAVGQVEGALSRHAEQVYNEALTSAEQQRARRIFVQMVRPGEGTEDTRRLARREELTGEADWDLVQKLATARLVVTDQEPEGQETVEIVHEALIQGWDRLRGWVSQDRTFRLWQDRLRFARNQWQATGKDNGALLRGVPLAEAEEWLAEREMDLGPLDREFVQTSIDLREKEQAQKEAQHQRELEQERALGEEQRKRARVLAVAAIVAVVLALMAVVFGVRSLRKAEEARSLALAAGAQQALSDNNTDLAIALALVANNLSQPPPPAQSALAAAAYYVPGTRLQLVGHTDRVTSAAFNPKDGRVAVSGSADHSLILWNLESGAKDPIIRKLIGHTDDVNSVAFSPDGLKILSASSDNSLILWDAGTGQVIRRFIGHSQQVNSVTFSPDGRTALSGSNDGHIIMWDIGEGAEIFRKTCSAEVSSVAFSPDGRLFAAGTQDDTVCIGEVETGEQTRLIRPAASFGVTSLAFNPDSNTVLVGAGGYDPGIFLWDLNTGALIQSLSGHIGGSTRVAWNSNGQMAVTGAYDNQVILWDMATGKAIRRFMGHTDDVTSVNFSPDDSLVLSGSADNTLRLWDISSGAEIRRFTGFIGMAVSPDGNTIASSLDGFHPVLLDVKTGEVHHFQGEVPQLTSLAFSPDGRIIFSGDWEGNLHLWHVGSGSPGKSFAGHPGGVTGIAISPDGRYVLSGSYGPPEWPGFEELDNLLILRDVDTGQIVHRFIGHNRIVRSVAISSDGRMALSGSEDASVRLWNIQTGEMLQKFMGHTDKVISVTFGPQDKTVLSTSLDQTIRLWDIETGKEIRRFAGDTMAVTTIALSPDGQIILSGSDDGSLRLWQLDTGMEIGHLTGHYGQVKNVAFRGDGQAVWSRSMDRTIRLWQIHPQQSLMEWTCRNRYVRELTCPERRQYGVEPFCGQDGLLPIFGICQSVLPVGANE